MGCEFGWPDIRLDRFSCQDEAAQFPDIDCCEDLCNRGSTDDVIINTAPLSASTEYAVTSMDEEMSESPPALSKWTVLKSRLASVITTADHTIRAELDDVHITADQMNQLKLEGI